LLLRRTQISLHEAPGLMDSKAGPELLPDIVRQTIRIGVVISIDEATAQGCRRCRQKFRRPPLVAFRLLGILLFGLDFYVLLSH